MSRDDIPSEIIEKASWSETLGLGRLGPDAAEAVLAEVWDDLQEHFISLLALDKSCVECGRQPVLSWRASSEWINSHMCGPCLNGPTPAPPAKAPEPASDLYCPCHCSRCNSGADCCKVSAIGPSAKADGSSDAAGPDLNAPEQSDATFVLNWVPVTYGFCENGDGWTHRKRARWEGPLTPSGGNLWCGTCKKAYLASHS